MIDIEFNYRIPPKPKCPTCQSTDSILEDRVRLFACGYEVNGHIVVCNCNENTYTYSDWGSESDWGSDRYFDAD